jgi:hypothetical protein
VKGERRKVKGERRKEDALSSFAFCPSPFAFCSSPFTLCPKDMKALQQRLYLVLFIGILFVIVSSCAAPPLEVFLSPNPSFQDSQTQSESVVPQNQEPVFPQFNPTQAIIVQDTASSREDKIVAQLDETLAEAQAYVHAGEARLQEQNPLEAIREFERARRVLEEDIDPALQYIQQTATIQGGMNILSEQRIQSIHTQRMEILAQINQAYDFQTLYLKQRERDQIDTLRAQNTPVLQPVLLDQRVAPFQSSRLIEKQRPVSSYMNFELLTEDIDHYTVRFQQRHNDFRECLTRANQYFPIVTSILSMHNVPKDLAYVALIESGFQPSIVASSGEAGLWQLSRSIARSYGLEVSSRRDERKDIEASTRAFARYISKLHMRFGSWELAILGYEMGEQDLQNRINRAGSYELQNVTQQLGRYSQEGAFLAKLAAAMTIAKNPKAYGFDVSPFNASGQITVQTNKPTVLPEMAELPGATLY